MIARLTLVYEKEIDEESREFIEESVKEHDEQALAEEFDFFGGAKEVKVEFEEKEKQELREKMDDTFNGSRGTPGDITKYPTLKVAVDIGTVAENLSIGDKACQDLRTGLIRKAKP